MSQNPFRPIYSGSSSTEETDCFKIYPNRASLRDGSGLYYVSGKYPAVVRLDLMAQCNRDYHETADGDKGGSSK